MPTIIRVTKDDIKWIRSIQENFIGTADHKTSVMDMEKFLTDDRTLLFSAIEEEIVVGYAIVYLFPSMELPGYLSYLYDIEVLSNQRRKGIGRLLMENLLAHLKSIGVIELWLGTATDNVPGQALFKATGGIKSGETFNDFTYELNVS